MIRLFCASLTFLISSCALLEDPAVTEKRKKFNQAYNSNDVYMTYSMISGVGSDRIGCSLSSYSAADVDQVIISKQKKPTLVERYENIESLLSTIGGNRYACTDLYLAVKDSVLAQEYFHKNFPYDPYYPDRKFEHSYDLYSSDKSMEIVMSVFSDVVFEDRKSYDLFHKLRYDKHNYASAQKVGYKDYETLTSDIFSKAGVSDPSGSEIKRFLELESEARSKGITFKKHIEELNRQVAVKETQKRKERSKNFPFYAVVQCNLRDGVVSLAACFQNTAIGFRTSDGYHEYNFMSFQRLGIVTSDGSLRIDLPLNFTSLGVQLGHEHLSISVRVYEQVNQKLVYSTSVAQQYSLAVVKRADFK